MYFVFLFRDKLFIIHCIYFLTEYIITEIDQTLTFYLENEKDHKKVFFLSYYKHFYDSFQEFRKLKF